MLTRKAKAIAGMALGLVLAVAPAAGAQAAAFKTTAVTFACQGDWPFESLTFTTSQTITTNVPSSVARGAAFTGTGSAAPYLVPTLINGEIPVTELRNFTLTLAVTGPATVTGATLSGGTNLGIGVPTVTTTSTTVTMTVPGPLTSGTTVTLPSININALAGATTGTARLKVAGTSVSDPGLRVTSVVPFDPEPPIVASSSCYPSPSPTLSSTAVV